MYENKTDFTEFNRALDKLMSANYSSFSQPSVKTVNMTSDNGSDSSQLENTGMGSLVVQVSTSGGSVPIRDARVTIMDTAGNTIVSQNTDSSGRTDTFSLPTPSASLSQKPGFNKPYATYNLRVEKQGYYTEEFLNLAVFDKIESIQPVALEPLDTDATEKDRVNVIDEATPNALM